MLRRSYDRVLALAERPTAPLWLFAIAFAEASFFPVPPDVLLIPMALAQPIIHFYHYEAAFAAFQHKFAEYGVSIILIKGLTPIPYKIVTIAAGAAAFSFPLFMGASVVTRGGRFFIEAVLLRLFGAPARDFIEDRLGLITAGIAVLIVAGFVALKFA